MSLSFLLLELNFTRCLELGGNLRARSRQLPQAALWSSYGGGSPRSALRMEEHMGRMVP